MRRIEVTFGLDYLSRVFLLRLEGKKYWLDFELWSWRAWEDQRHWTQSWCWPWSFSCGKFAQESVV